MTIKNEHHSQKGYGEKKISPNHRNAVFTVNKCLKWLKQERAFPYDSIDLDTMSHNSKLSFGWNRKVHLWDEDRKIYRCEIAVNCPDLKKIDDPNRNLTKICQGYLIIFEANTKSKSPFSIDEIWLSPCSKKIMILRIILEGR